MKVRFTGHANWKIRILRVRGVQIKKKMVEDTVLDPKSMVIGLGGRQIAEGDLDDEHVIRVVFVREGRQIRVITLYPARRGRY